MLDDVGRHVLVLSLVLCSFFTYGANDKPIIEEISQESPVVVELYTSQGCYSCPPADALLGKLAEQDNVIALSCHVTYWNYLGWKDTFSRSFCDQRQRQYQKSLVGGSRGVYTPQMIINGRYGGVGSRQKTIRGLLDVDRQRQPVLLPIELVQQSQQLSIRLPSIVPDIKSHHQIQLLLLGTSGKHVLPIHHGENSGKQLPYYNPIEYTKNLGRWDGQAMNLQQQLPDNAAIKDWIVLAQRAPVGEIVAAGKLSLNQ